MRTPKLVIKQDRIDAFEATANQFFRDILDMDYVSVLATDLAQLSDFSFSGDAEGLDPTRQTLNEMYDAWDAWVMVRVCARFGIAPFDPRIRLIDLFTLIEAQASARVH